MQHFNLYSRYIPAFQRIHTNQGDNDLLRSYTQEWANFSVIVEYLPRPFSFIERGVPRAHMAMSRADDKHGETLFVVRNIMYTLVGIDRFNALPNLTFSGMGTYLR